MKRKIDQDFDGIDYVIDYQYQLQMNWVEICDIFSCGFYDQ